MNVNLELNGIIKKISNCMNVAISENTLLTTDLDFDSVMMIELIVEIENHFNIEFEDKDLDVENLTKYSNLLYTIKSKINNK